MSNPTSELDQAKAVARTLHEEYPAEAPGDMLELAKLDALIGIADALAGLLQAAQETTWTISR